MIFTHIARVVAVLGMMSGAILMVAGARAADVEPRWGNTQFNMGLLSAVVSIALGTLAEISFTLRKSTSNG